MKKIVIVLMILFTISLAGGLYNTLAQLDNVGQEMTDYIYMEQFPCEMPDLTLNPIAVPLY